MRQSGLLAVVLFAPMLCVAAPRELRLQQLPGQEVNFADGVGWVTTGRDIRVSATISPDARKSAWLTFVVTNNSAEPITVQESSVSVEANGRRLKTYTAQELLAAEQSRQKWQKFGAGLAAGLNSYSASQQGNYSATGTYQGNFAASAIGGPRVNGTTSGSVYFHGTDPVARQQAIANANQSNQAMIASLQAQQAMRTQTLDQRLLKGNTIQPGQTYGGDVLVELPPKGRGVIAVGVQLWIKNEPHTFIAFADGAPTPAMLERIAQIPSQGAEATSSVVPAATADPALVPAALEQIPAPSASKSASSAPDSRTLAAAKIMTSEALRAASRGIVDAMVANAMEPNSTLPPELTTLLAQPDKCREALFEFLTVVGEETRASNAVEQMIASSMSYDEIMDTTAYFRSSAGQRLLALMANTSAFNGFESKMVAVGDERLDAIASQSLAKQFPGVSWEALVSAMDGKGAK